MKKYEKSAYVTPRDKRFFKRPKQTAPTEFKKLRVVSGEFRGRELKSGLSSTHPMGSRERLAIFNAIGPSLKNAIVLDAFAGTGALGLEALSLGAAHATFIEKNRKAAAVIEDNIQSLGVQTKTRVIVDRAEALDFDQKFDIVFADPPYDLFNRVSVETLNRLAASASKYFVLSHPANFDPHSVNAKLKSTRSYANARISIFIA